MTPEQEDQFELALDTTRAEQEFRRTLALIPTMWRRFGAWRILDFVGARNELRVKQFRLLALLATPRRKRREVMARSFRAIKVCTADELRKEAERMESTSERLRSKAQVPGLSSVDEGRHDPRWLERKSKQASTLAQKREKAREHKASQRRR